MFNSWKKTVWIQCFFRLSQHVYSTSIGWLVWENKLSSTVIGTSSGGFLHHFKRLEILICKRNNFLITVLPWNPALFSSLLTVFEEVVFSKWLLISALIFGYVFLWSFLAIGERFQWAISDSFRVLPEFYFSEEVFPSFSNVVITFETVILATQNYSAVFVTLAPTIRAPIIWPF